MKPQWANSFSDSEYEQFLALVMQFFTDRKIEVSTSKLDKGYLIITTDTTDERPALLGLNNLARMCLKSNRNEWAVIIQEHFENFIDFQNFLEEFERNLHDFSFVKQYLGVKLYPMSYLTAPSETLTKPLLEDAPQVLVFDLPTVIAPVRMNQAEKWDIETETLFEIGKHNIREKYNFDYELLDMKGVEVYAIITDHAFSSNILFDIETKEGLLGKHGSLVGLPNRHETAIYPIENKQVAQSMEVLLSIILGRKQEGPGVSISEKLFWYHDGVFQTIPYEIKGRNLDFYPPPEFIQLLDQLEVDF